ncbi:MAG TPA: hypothetical protein VFK90_12020 [Anaeromyxobacter sp.]|nr:hypothetical protein [Anaeromyxobacter sp.]
MPPTFASAAGQAFRAAAHEAWLVPIGAVVGVARRLALWPALAVLAAAVVRAVLAALRASPFDPTSAARGALLALASPRVQAAAAGLALAGVLLSGALRVAWVAGALPALGLALSGAPRAPRFAAGVAYGTPRVLATALLGLAAEAGAFGFSVTLAVAAVEAAARLPRGAAGPAVAAACALALVLAAAAPLLASAASDAAVARAAIGGEGPARAFAGAARRLLARPASLVLAALAFGLAGVLAPLSVEGVGGVVLGFAQGVPRAVLVGPNLMVGGLAALAAAAVDVWWLATIAALACGGSDPD